MRRLPFLLVAVAVIVGLLVASRFRHRPDKVSGFIESDQVRVGSLRRCVAAAAVEAVQASLKEFEVRSEVAGIVEALELRPGDLVAP